MKRSGFLKRKTPLRVRGISETVGIKDDIQATCRVIVIKRDGGCILRNLSATTTPQTYDVIYEMQTDLPPCNGYAKDGHLILQADHLITRANSATFADTRLIVTLCKGHHGWKSVGSNARKAQYDAIVRTLISPERVKLWDACERTSWKPTKIDWRITLAAVKQQLAAMV